MKRLIISTTVILLILARQKAYGQNATPYHDSLLTDISDAFRSAFHTQPRPGGHHSTIALLPALGYNPSIGFKLGANITGGKQLGQKHNTYFSTGALQAYFTTKDNAVLQFRHNVFTGRNQWNFQGNWQVAHLLVHDYGIGTGLNHIHNTGQYYGIPFNNDRDNFPVQYTYVSFQERAYYRTGNHFLLGAGISTDLYTHVYDRRVDSTGISPAASYAQKWKFTPDHYNAVGLLLNCQYITRDHPNRAYKGAYADIILRFNSKWMGSDKNAVQLTADLRKYISLSSVNPTHLLAFWYTGSILISGIVPYFQLPGTAYDLYNRGGRGYTIGRFKGYSYMCGEAEYRFPILRNGFISGVTFGSLQTAGNRQTARLLQYIEPGGGAGFRILFNKYTRTNVCIDYALGRYGSRGFFLGLNEAF